MLIEAEHSAEVRCDAVAVGGRGRSLADSRVLVSRARLVRVRDSCDAVAASNCSTKQQVKTNSSLLITC